MRKLKKFALNSNVNCLTAFEQMNVVGGTNTSKDCSTKPKDQCSGECEIDGHKGSCGWTEVWNRCTCGVAYYDYQE